MTTHLHLFVVTSENVQNCFKKISHMYHHLFVHISEDIYTYWPGSGWLV